MNVMKNEFLSKRQKLRTRGQKYSKSNILSYHTVTRGLPVPLSNVLLGFEDAGKSANTYETSITTSKIGPTSAESTSDESFAGTFTMNIFHSRTSCDENETSLPFFARAGPGSNADSAADVRHLTASVTDFTETPTAEETFSFTKMETSDNGGVFDFMHYYTRMSDYDSLSGEASDFSFTTDENNTEGLPEDFRKGHQMATSSRTPHRDQASSSKTYSGSHSDVSIKTYGSTPRSVKSTPKVPGSGRIFSSDSETGSYILAITEGRGLARGEVGIAAIDPQRPQLILCQISDNQRYIHSLTKISVFNFVEIIMPNTFIDGSSVSKLYLDIREYFPRVSIMSVQRRHFNESVGLELINQYSSPESESIIVLIRDKFYALSAAAALIKYVEYSQNVLFAPRSVKVEFRGTEDSMLIDLNAANRLELVVNRTNNESVSNNTLLGVLKHCRTKGGARLLRANILQPPCLLSKIKMRLDCVTELIDKPLFFFALESAIAGFVNVENLLTLCMHEPQQDGLRAAEFQLKYVLLLKTILEQLPMLKTSLEQGTSEFYSEVRQNLTDVRYKIILDRILQVVPENVKSARGSLTAHLHTCFAIKTGINGLLDIAKKTYCEIVQEIWDLINSLREKYNLPLRMSFSSPRGFHIQYTPEKNVKVPGLPKEFILIQKAKSTYYFYTSELVALDQRSHQVLDEVKIMSNVILYELLNDIRQNIGCLFNLCEYVAELDVIVGFAHVSSGQNYVRPEFGDILNVVESRHPILDVIHEGKIIPNDIFAASDRNFTVITGPNQSGKSIYIGQIALLQIMAQMGCYVPAKEASFRLVDRLFFRIGCDDSIENNSSTLIAEMREMEYIKQTLTENSLVIIDELCRGTSVEEGTSLAFTICEELLDSTAFIFITTHYMLLTKLEELYFNVTNYHFESQLVECDSGMSLRFSHKKLAGVTEAEQYGLQIAQQTSFPPNILKKAKEIARKLQSNRKPLPEVSGLAALYRISQQLNEELSEESLDGIEPTISRFKTMMLALGPMNEYYSDVEMDTTSSTNKKIVESPRTTETRERGRERITTRKTVTYQLYKQIKRKYNRLRLMRRIK